jgi:hypothetical protein
MQPIPARSDHLHAVKTAGTGGVLLTVSVPAGVARACIIVLHEVGASPHQSPRSSSDWPTAAISPPRRTSTTASQTPTSPMVKSTQPHRHHDTLTAAGLTFDIESSQAWTHVHGAQNIAIMGFFRGGTLALWAAAELHVDAAVTFYGTNLASPRWSGTLRRTVTAVQENCC